MGEHILQCRFEQIPHRIAIERITDQYDTVVAIQQKRLKPRVGLNRIVPSDELIRPVDKNRKRKRTLF